MKVCGFSFIRNAVQFDYPIVEAIQSVLPVCDAFIIAVGKSEDKTLELIQGINSPKIQIIDTIWNDSLREGGEVLAIETDKAFRAVPAEYDWAFYIQGDEVVHEKYLPAIEKAMREQLGNKKVEGLLLNYVHFYGSYDYVGEALSWYRREVRIIRNDKSFFSYLDAQGFRKKPNRKLKVKQIDAYIHHYGWVRDPRALQRKNVSMQKLWHDDDWVDKNIIKSEEFNYGDVETLSLFKGSHPKVMEDRISRKNWYFEQDISRNSFTFKDRIRLLVERWTRWRMGEYRNYKLIK